MTVTRDGCLTAVGEGTAVITASLESGVSAVCEITVDDAGAQPDPGPAPDPDPDPEPGPDPEPQPDPDPEPGTEIRAGDVNGDGKVNIEDLRITLRKVCGKVQLTAEQEQAADVEADGTVDIKDLRKILRYVCGKISEF